MSDIVYDTYGIPCSVSVSIRLVSQIEPRAKCSITEKINLLPTWGPGIFWRTVACTRDNEYFKHMFFNDDVTARECFLHVSNPFPWSVILILPDEMKIDGFMRRDVLGPLNDALKYRTRTRCLSCAHIYPHIYSTIKAALANRRRRFRRNVTPLSLAPRAVKPTYWGVRTELALASQLVLTRILLILALTC